jgi:hypothetical protein
LAGVQETKTGAWRFGFFIWPTHQPRGICNAPLPQNVTGRGFHFLSNLQKLNLSDFGVVTQFLGISALKTLAGGSQNSVTRNVLRRISSSLR